MYQASQAKTVPGKASTRGAASVFACAAWQRTHCQKRRRSSCHRSLGPRWAQGGLFHLIINGQSAALPAVQTETGRRRGLQVGDGGRRIPRHHPAGKPKAARARGGKNGKTNYNRKNGGKRRPLAAESRHPALAFRGGSPAARRRAPRAAPPVHRRLPRYWPARRPTASATRPGRRRRPVWPRLLIVARPNRIPDPHAREWDPPAAWQGPKVPV